MGFVLGKIADFIRETDKVLFLLCVSAGIYGSVLIYSAGGSRRFFVQLAAVALGIACAVIISLIDYERLCKFWPVIAALSTGFFMLTFVIGYAPNDVGSKSWIRLPMDMSLQPSELLKIAFIITFSVHISRMKQRPPTFVNVLLLTGHGLIPIGLIALQGDDGSAVIMAGIFAGMMVAAGIKLRYFLAAGGMLGVLIPFAWINGLFGEYQMKRITILFSENKEILGIGYQQYRARIAMAEGGLLGKGLFNGSEVQSGSLPKAYNDFIYAACGEELGYLGCIVIVILLLAICIRILQVGHRSKDTLGRMLCSGVFSLIAIQAVVNIGMNLSVMPVIGITLPFFTAGGTSLLGIFMGIGLVISVYSHRNKRILYLKDSI